MLNPYLLKCWCSIKTVATCSTICSGVKMCCTHSFTPSTNIHKHTEREATEQEDTRKRRHRSKAACVNYPYEFSVEMIKRKISCALML